MRVNNRLFALVALLPALGSSFLIPADVDMHSVAHTRLNPSIAPASYHTFTCTGCKYPEDPSDKRTQLMFKVENPDGKVTVNGHDLTSITDGGLLAVPQLPSSSEIDSNPVLLRHQFEAADQAIVQYELTVAAEELNPDLTKNIASLKVVAVNNEPVHDLPVIQIRYLKSLSAGVVVQESRVHQFINDFGLDGEETACTNFFCKLSEFMVKKLESAKQMLPAAPRPSIFKKPCHKPLGAIPMPAFDAPLIEDDVFDAPMVIDDTFPIIADSHGELHNHPIEEEDDDELFGEIIPVDFISGDDEVFGIHPVETTPTIFPTEPAPIHSQPITTQKTPAFPRVISHLLIGIACGMAAALSALIIAHIGYFAYCKVKGVPMQSVFGRKRVQLADADVESGKGLLRAEDEGLPPYTDSEDGRLGLVEEKF